MRELTSLLTGLVSPGGLPQTLTAVLERTLSSLAADGVALFTAERGSKTTLDTRASPGSLATTAPLVGAELSRTGIPATLGFVPHPAGSGGENAYLYCPVNVEGGRPWSVLVLHGPAMEGTARDREGEILLAAAHLRDMLAAEREVAGVTEGLPDPISGLSLVADGLGLPLCVCDLVMKKHTVFGWEVLHKADLELGEQSFLTLAATIALSHHERYDGKGYPRGTAGEKIPLSARIAAIADVYDALTSSRPCKEAWSHERAVSEILGQAGRQFDPVLAQIFRDMNPRFADVRRQHPG